MDAHLSDDPRCHTVLRRDDERAAEVEDELAAGFLLTEGVRARADILRIEPCGSELRSAVKWAAHADAFPPALPPSQIKRVAAAVIHHGPLDFHGPRPRPLAAPPPRRHSPPGVGWRLESIIAAILGAG